MAESDIFLLKKAKREAYSHSWWRKAANLHIWEAEISNDWLYLLWFGWNDPYKLIKKQVLYSLI